MKNFIDRESLLAGVGDAVAYVMLDSWVTGQSWPDDCFMSPVKPLEEATALYTADQLAAAVAIERERCAKVVEEFPHDQLGCLDEVAAAIRGLYRELADYKAPPKESIGEAYYYTDAGEYTIHFDYHRAEAATLNYPGCDEEVELCAVYLNGANVIDDLSDNLLGLMKEACLEDMEAERIQAEIDYAEMRATA